MLSHPHTFNSLERITCIYLALFTILGAYLAIFNQTYFDNIYTLEDGFLEWLTFIALSTTAAISIKRTVTIGTYRKGFFLLTSLFISLIFIFGAGEEISWGQRLFSIESSDFFKSNNAQAETNLHNMVVNGVKINQLIFGKGLALIFLVYLAIITPLYNKNQKFAAFIDRCGIPIPQNYQIIGYILALVIVEVILKNYSDTGRRGELTEFSVSYLVLLNIIFSKNASIYTLENKKS